MSEATGRDTRQTVRQAARRAAQDAQAKLRAERQERDKRLAGIAMDVLVALGERDAAVTTNERRAGAALMRLLEDERLSLAEVQQWCGPSLTRQEIARLRRCGNDHHGAEQNPDLE
ncbi:hypothetical protein FHX52_1722 [Humibacillus xanthopallidus]|uniref:Uncharacterized protein n=1 Tax=Humibacillus xanthopallidus TaxID=412689 RepID=A0A543PWX5_9MICO|nr:hypothetical protein [Humibacillus xanthopallidus]TQN48583.1 hypothetical protein FHX52_1722 [Humibacillus xanthopallidus]